MNRVASGLILTIPALLLIFLFFMIPMYNVITDSFTLRSGFSFAYYDYLFNNKNFQEAFRYTLFVATVTTVGSALLGLIFSFALRNTFFGRKLAIFVYQLNISIPVLMVALLMFILFTNNGFFATIMYNLGMIVSPNDFHALILDREGIGVLVAYIWKFFPFIGISILSALQTVSVDYEDLSKTLGIGPVRTFIHVTLPSIKTSILSTSLIVFAFCFGSYDLPSLIGSRETLPVMAYYDFFISPFTNSEYLAYAITSIICLVMVVCSVAYLYLTIPRGRSRRE